MGLINFVNVPTHRCNKLDRIYSSQPVYKTCKVITSTIHTAHKTIIARSDNDFISDVGKTRQSTSFRIRTPDRNASLLICVMLIGHIFMIHLILLVLKNHLNCFINGLLPCSIDIILLLLPL